jgi:WD40 repeat protein
MKRVWLAALAATVFCPQLAAGELQRDVLSIGYSKDKGLVAAAYRGGQVVVWDFESGRVKNVYNASAPKNTLNQPLAHFSAGGRRLAFTQEGDAGLISYDLETGASTVLVPHRLLVKGISAFRWSQRADAVLVAIGRDIFLINAQGHIQWQHRLETRALITDVVWHPSEQYYTVATDDGEVSTWEASSGRVIASAKLPVGATSAAVQVGWTSEETLAAAVRGVSLAVLDAETLKPKKTTACNCRDFTWSPGGKELFAWAPPSIAIFSESGQRTREIRTPFDGDGPIEWAGEGRVLTAFSDSAAVLRDVRTGKVLRTFGLQ